MKKQALSSTALAHRMYETSFIVYASSAAGPLQMEVQVLSNTTPAHRMYQMSPIVRTSWQAGLLPDEGSSAFTIPISVDISLGMRRRHRFTTQPRRQVSAQGVSAAVGAWSTGAAQCHLPGRLACPQMKDQALSSTAPAHRMYEMSLMVFASWAAGLLPDARSTSTTPAHRMYQMSFLVCTSWLAGLLPDEGSSAVTIAISVDIG
jgi:hypothetical protein